MADLTGEEAAQAVKISGDPDSGSAFIAGVELISGKKRLLVDSQVNVDVAVSELLGFDDFADTWFAIGSFSDSTGVGAAGDTVKVDIAAGDDATRFPAVSVTTTVNAAMVADSDPEIALAKQIVSDLNLDSTFSQLWRASRVKNNSTVHISSKLLGEFGERPIAGNFVTTTTGTTVTTDAFDKILRKGKQVSLSRDPRDRRFGILGISGDVKITPGALSDTFDELALNGSSSNLRIDGSVTEVVFTIIPDTDKDKFITQFRLYGNASNIKFGQFLALNSPLTNGIEIEIKSEDKTRMYPVIKTTDDFKHKLSIPITEFMIDVQPSLDDISGGRMFNNPFILKKQGTFSTDDFIKIIIRDDLTSQSLLLLEFSASGFKEETT